MIDWNNDGKIGADEIYITEVLLDEEENQKGRNGNNKPNGSCLSCILLMLIPPILVMAVIL